MFQQIFSFFMSILLTIFAFFTPEVPAAQSLDNIADLADICIEYELADKLYVLSAGNIPSQDARHMAISLQGIVNKTQPTIYIQTNSADASYIEEIRKSGVEIVYKDENGNPWTLETLLKKFVPYIGDNGYVLYRESAKAEGLNMATNLAAIYGWLPVPATLEDMAKEVGLEKKEDFSDDIYNAVFQWVFFEKYKKEFNYSALVHVDYAVSGLRDLAIQQGFFTFYINEDEDTESLRSLVMQYAGDNTPVLGWVEYEVNFVEQASAKGNMALPSDHSHNNSVLASFTCEIPEQKGGNTTVYTDKTKHYCALVFSDGDNLQWIQNGYSEYYQKLALEKQFPITWSFAPLLQDFASVVVKKVYEDASADDYFIAGVSGAGYIHPTEYPLDALEGFTDITAASMAASNINYVSILDATPENELQEAKLMSRLEYYARYENIYGGVLSLDPDRYEGGQGKIYFVNNKPFISYRLSLWHPDGENAEVTNEWLEEQANKVNSYPADLTSINGYSVVNIHPWSVSVENLAYFVSQLDEDVVLVTLDDLLTMINENIPHTNAKPE